MSRVKPYVRIGGGLIVLAVLVALFGSKAVGYVLAGYPKDTIKREALNRCASADPHFLRFSARDRADCYATAHLPLATAAADR